MGNWHRDQEGAWPRKADRAAARCGPCVGTCGKNRETVVIYMVFTALNGTTFSLPTRISIEPAERRGWLRRRSACERAAVEEAGALNRIGTDATTGRYAGCVCVRSAKVIPHSWPGCNSSVISTQAARLGALPVKRESMGFTLPCADVQTLVGCGAGVKLHRRGCRSCPGLGAHRFTLDQPDGCLKSPTPRLWRRLGGFPGRMRSAELAAVWARAMPESARWPLSAMGKPA